jgi:hypothetical protein
MPVPSQESEWSWVYVRDIEFSFFYDFSIALGIVPTVWYFLIFHYITVSKILKGDVGKMRPTHNSDFASFFP